MLFESSLGAFLIERLQRSQRLFVRTDLEFLLRFLKEVGKGGFREQQCEDRGQKTGGHRETPATSILRPVGRRDTSLVAKQRRGSKPPPFSKQGDVPRTRSSARGGGGEDPGGGSPCRSWGWSARCTYPLLGPGPPSRRDRRADCSGPGLADSSHPAKSASCYRRRPPLAGS